jgi:hypothetical protein
MPPPRSSRSASIADDLIVALTPHVRTESPIDYHADKSLELDQNRIEQHTELLTSLYGVSGGLGMCTRESATLCVFT